MDDDDGLRVACFHNSHAVNNVNMADNIAEQTINLAFVYQLASGLIIHGMAHFVT